MNEVDSGSRIGRIKGLLTSRLFLMVSLILAAIGLSLLFVALFYIGQTMYTTSDGRHTPFQVETALLGGALMTLGSVMVLIHIRRKSKVNPRYRRLSRWAVLPPLICAVLVFIVLNPLVSPYDFIRDSDLDGFSDDQDDYPHDPDRFLFVQIDLWYDITITTSGRNVVIYSALPEVDTDLIFIKFRVDYQDEPFEVGRLSSLGESAVDGLSYYDHSPLGVLSEGDSFVAGLYLDYISLSDENGYCYVDVWLK